MLADREVVLTFVLMLAGLATGMWSSLDEIADAWRPRVTVEPGRRLDREQWAAAVTRAAGWIPDLSALDF